MDRPSLPQQESAAAARRRQTALEIVSCRVILIVDDD